MQLIDIESVSDFEENVRKRMELGGRAWDNCLASIVIAVVLQLCDLKFTPQSRHTISFTVLAKADLGLTHDEEGPWGTQLVCGACYSTLTCPFALSLTSDL